MKKAARVGRPSLEEGRIVPILFARSALLSEAVSASIARMLRRRCLMKYEWDPY
jgi:hypothetical protein